MLYSQENGYGSILYNGNVTVMFQILLICDARGIEYLHCFVNGRPIGYYPVFFLDLFFFHFQAHIKITFFLIIVISICGIVQ